MKNDRTHDGTNDRTKDEPHEVVLRVFLLRNLYPLLQQTILVLHAGRRVVGWVEHFELGDCCVPLVLKLDPLALNSEDIMKVVCLSLKKFKPGVELVPTIFFTSCLQIA